MLFSAPVIHGLQCRIRLMNHQIRTLKIQTTWLRKYIWSTHQNEVVPLKMMLHGTIWFLVQHSIAMLEQCGNHLKPCWNNVATLCCAPPSSIQSWGCLLFFYGYTVAAQSVEKTLYAYRGAVGEGKLFLHFFKLAKH